jgi:hypothetical protein
MNEQALSLFLELLRSAIWNKPAVEELFQGAGSSVWEELFNLANSQGVIALLYDGIMTLPAACRPEKKLLYKLFLKTEAIERLNRKLNEELKHLAAAYDRMGCSFVLLKGQGNATLYPRPEHRSPGDIDLFLYRKEDYWRANEWARRKGYKMDAENIHHRSFDINGVHVENHKKISYFGIRRYDRLLESEIGEIIRNNRFVELEIDDLKVAVLPPEFNAFYIFYHLFHHFIHLGVGLRQFCDWVLFMHAYSERMEKAVIAELAREFDLSEAIALFASVAVKYLGARTEVFPFTVDPEGSWVDMVMDDILKGGNFGYTTFEKSSYRGKWDAKWHRFTYSAARTRRISAIAPHHINRLPVIKIVTNLKLLFNK